MEEKKQTPVVQVGIGVFLLRHYLGQTQILLGYRGGSHNSHGWDQWAAPGGKPDLWESPPVGGAREVREETSIIVLPEDLHFITYTDDRFPEFGRHFVTLFFYSYKFEGEPKLMEPTKCQEWKWWDLDKIPFNVMSGTKQAVAILLREERE
jgi:8-oxo-dGTP diphosphatase